MSASSRVAVMLDDKILVSSDERDLVQVEGNWYFPEQDLVDRSRFVQSDTHTTCGWKGVASYFSYKKDDGEILKDIAWFYPIPKEGAEKVAERVAFYVGKSGLKVGSPPIDASLGA